MCKLAEPSACEELLWEDIFWLHFKKGIFWLHFKEDIFWLMTFHYKKIQTYKEILLYIILLYLDMDYVSKES